MANRVDFLSSKSNSTTEPQTTKIEPKNESIDNTQIYADFGDSIEISDEDMMELLKLNDVDYGKDSFWPVFWKRNHANNINK